MERKEALRAWTLVDELVVEIHHMTAKLPGGGPEDLPAAMRARALRSGLLIVKGVHGAGSDLAPALAGAIGSLSELRYFLYLARRLGMIDLRRYRSACAQHEKV